VARIRRLAGAKRVGHAGTLDPAATGLLVVGVGRATKLLTHLVGLDKAYTATIRLGAATTTDDAEGRVTVEAPAAGLALASVETAMSVWRGRVAQVPSAVSAIKVNGQRAYARVRDGQSVELAAREVEISRFDLLASRVEGDFLDLDVLVECSSGTYVRALARDLGSALGVGGHLSALRRLRVGPFDVADATTLESLASDFALRPGAWAARRLWPVWNPTEAQARGIAQGQCLTVDPDWVLAGATSDALGGDLDPQPEAAAAVAADGADQTPGLTKTVADGIGSGSQLVAAIGPDGKLVALVRLTTSDGARFEARPVTVFA
jgi:tRNA pseudouridine55 synthase